MELIQEIEHRQSTRVYQATPVENEKLERVLDAGRRAPSAKNRQPWRFIVLTESNIRSSIQEAAFGQEHVGQAPVIIAMCTTNVDYRMPNGQHSHPMDLSFACAFMMMQAEAEGLGNCVITTFDEMEVKQQLSVPYSMRICMLLLIGYAGENPLKAQRMPRNRVISYEHW